MKFITVGRHRVRADLVESVSLGLVDYEKVDEVRIAPKAAVFVNLRGSGALATDKMLVTEANAEIERIVEELSGYETLSCQAWHP